MKFSAMLPPDVAPLISNCSDAPFRISAVVIATLRLAKVVESTSLICALALVPSATSLAVVSAPLISV